MKNKMKIYLFIGMSVVSGVFFRSVEASVLVDHTFNPTSSAQASDVCVRTTFTERGCVQTFSVPVGDYWAVSSIDMALSGDSATACNVSAYIRRNDSAVMYTAGTWKASSTNSVAVIDNPNAFGVYTFNFNDDQAVLSSGQYAIVVALDGTCAGGGHVLLGLATSTDTYSGGEWYVANDTIEASSTSQGSYSDRSVWFRVNGGGVGIDGDSVQIVLPDNTSVGSPYVISSTGTLAISLTMVIQTASSNVLEVDQINYNTPSLIERKYYSIPAGIYWKDVTIYSPYNAGLYEIRVSLNSSTPVVVDRAYVQWPSTAPQITMSGGGFGDYENCTTVDGWFSAKEFFCELRNAGRWFIIPDDDAQTMAYNQILGLRQYFPFSIVNELYGSARDSYQSVSDSGSSEDINFPFVVGVASTTIKIIDSNGMVNLLGNDVKNLLFEFEGFFFWLCGGIIILSVIIRSPK